MSITLQRTALDLRVRGRLLSGDKILNTKNTYTRVDKIKLKLTTVYREGEAAQGRTDALDLNMTRHSSTENTKIN